MAVLRGAPVEVNAWRVVQVVSALIVATLAVLTISFTLSGLHRNTDISDLQHHGVSVTVTITTCSGDLGGSGSTLADYRCEGDFLLNGQRHYATVPGHTFRANGSTATFITASNNPGLLATTFEVNNERASASVFILPAFLLVALICFAALLARRKSRRNIAPG